MKNRESVLALIQEIWISVYPFHCEATCQDSKNKHYTHLVKSLSLRRDSINNGDEYNFSMMHCVLMCIKYSINKKSSTNSRFYSYLNDFNKMQKRTFEGWLNYLTPIKIEK